MFIDLPEEDSLEQLFRRVNVIQTRKRPAEPTSPENMWWLNQTVGDSGSSEVPNILLFV